MNRSQFQMLLKGLCFAAVSTSGLAQAQNLEFTFNRQAGFRSAQACAVKSMTDTGLRVLQDTTAGRDFRALVKSSTDRGFDIVAVSGGSKSSNYMDDLMQSMTSSTSMNPEELSDFVIEITQKSNQKIGTTNVALQGSHFQVAMDNDQYVTFACGEGAKERDYLAFDVFVAKSQTAVARVGVSLSDLSLFKNITIRTADEAEKALNDQQAKTASKAKAQATSTVANFRSAAPAALAATTANKATVAPVMPMQRPAALSIAQVPVEQGTTREIICSAKSVSVQSSDLSKTAFTAKAGEKVMLVQSFGDEKQTRVVNGKTVTYVKIQAPDQSGTNTGWIDSSVLSAPSKCSAVKSVEAAATVPAATTTAAADSKISADFVFPTIKRPTTSYLTGQRRFRANRSGGRLHAACDLYRTKGESTVAVSQGTIVRDRYYFYQGTYALEMRMSDGRIARYGEVLGKGAPGVSGGKSVKIGQTVGFVGKVNSNCCDPMLHFEMYKGTGKGALTQRDSKGFQRRSDLMDGTQTLESWEKQTFGASF